MEKFYNKVWEILTMVWGILWIGIITIGSVAALIWATKWLLSLVG